MTWDRQTSAAVSRSRRQFIRETTCACLGASFLPSHASAAQAQRRKAVIITFGGGARDDETFMPGGHENIPHLLKELLPQATFFTQFVNRGILGHDVANASLATDRAFDERSAHGGANVGPVISPKTARSVESQNKVDLNQLIDLAR